MTATLAAPVRPDRAEVVERQPYRLRLTPHVAAELGRYLAPVVAEVRAAFEDRLRTRSPGGTDEITIDLSGAPTVPGAQLILLVTLLRQTVGNGVEITLAGVRPGILGSLVVFDLPPDVVLTDSRGRRWTG